VGRRLSLGNTNIASATQGSSSNINEDFFSEMDEQESSTPNTVLQNPRAASGKRPPAPPTQNECDVPSPGTQLGVQAIAQASEILANAQAFVSQLNAPPAHTQQATAPQVTAPQANLQQGNVASQQVGNAHPPPQKSGEALQSANHTNNAQINNSVISNPNQNQAGHTQNYNQAPFPRGNQPKPRARNHNNWQNKRSNIYMQNRTPHMQSSANHRQHVRNDGHRSQTHQQPRYFNNHQYSETQINHEARSQTSFREPHTRHPNFEEGREVVHHQLHDFANHPQITEPLYDQSHANDLHNTNQRHTLSPSVHSHYSNEEVHQGVDYGHPSNFHANGSNQGNGHSVPMASMQVRMQQQASYNPPPKLFLKPIEPQIFSGDKHAMSAIEFLDELDRYQVATGYTEREMLYYVIPHFLRGEAQQWWVSSQMFSKFASYNEFRNEFQNQYQPFNYKEQLRLEFDRRTQGEHERLSDYIVKILQYYRRLGIKHTEMEVIHRVITGVNPEYTPYFRTSQHFVNFRDFQSEAHVVDAQVARARQYVPPGRNSIEPNLLPQESSYELLRPQYSENRHYNNDTNSTWTHSSRSHDPYRNTNNGTDTNISHSQYTQNSDRRVSFNLQDQTRDADKYETPERFHESQNMKIEISPKEPCSRTSQYDTKTRHDGHSHNIPAPRRNESQSVSSQFSRDRSRSPSSERQRSNYRGKMSCFRCGGEHMIRECTQDPPSSGNGRSPDHRRQ